MTRILRYLVFALCPFAFGCNGRPDDEITIVVIPKGLTHEHWQSVRRGAERAAADLAEEGIRVRVIFDGPLRERDAMEQIRIVDRRVATGASGIVLAPQHSQTMTACVKRAADTGVPVVVIDSGLGEMNDTVKYVATDNREGGRMAARYLLQRLREQGNTKPRLVLFRYAVGSEATEQRELGFEETVKKECPDAVWVSTDKYAGSTRDSAMREAGPLVHQFKDQMDGIFAPNESSASGMLDVLRSHELNRKVLLMAFDASKPVLQAIQEGDMIGSILQDPYKMGHRSTWCCVRHILGDDVRGTDRPDQLNSTGERLITRDNVNSPETLELFDPAVQARRTMDRLRFPKRVNK